MTLFLDNYDATWITTDDGSEGIWMGIGFNSAVMTPTNVVVCQYLYTGNTIFGRVTCQNGQNANPSHSATTFPDPTSDIYKVSTVIVKLNTTGDSLSQM